jgi:hypothetical protein
VNDDPIALQARRSRVGLLLEFELFAASLSANSSVAAQIRIVAIVVTSMFGALVIFAAVVLAVAVVAQKEPLCEMRGVTGD